VALTHMARFLHHDAPTQKFTTKILSQSPAISLLTSPITTHKTQRLPTRSLVQGPDFFALQKRTFVERNVVNVKNIDQIRMDLVSLIDEEIEGLAISKSENKFLEESGFQLEEKDGVVYLRKLVDNQNILVKFELPSDEYDENQEEEWPEEGEEEGAENERAEEEQQEEQQERTAKLASLDVEVERAVKGQPEKIFMECAVGKDKNIYLENLRFGDEKQRRLWFSDLSESLQERIYDYLDHLGLDENTANFIADYCDNFRARTTRDSLEKMKGFLRPAPSSSPRKK